MPLAVPKMYALKARVKSFLCRDNCVDKVRI